MTMDKSDRELYLRAYLERVSTPDKNGELPDELREFHLYFQRVLSSLLSEIEQEFSLSEGRKLQKEVLAQIATRAKHFNGLASAVSGAQMAYRKDPGLFSANSKFAEKLKRATSQRIDSKLFDAYFSEMSNEPESALYIELGAITGKIRLLRRYIRSRFCMRFRKGRWKRSQEAEQQREFEPWFIQRFVRDGSSTIAGEELTAVYETWLDECSYQDALRTHALVTLLYLETQLLLWRLAILLEPPVLTQETSAADLKERCGNILARAKTYLSETPFTFTSSLLQQKQDLGLPCENETALLTALVAGQVKIFNQETATAIKARGEYGPSAKLEAIAPNLILALGEYRSGTLPRGRDDRLSASVRNRVANILRQEEPTEHSRERSLGDDEENNSESIFEKVALESAMREWTRTFQQIENMLDFEHILSKAKLSDMELQVLELISEGLTETEIANQLGIAVGTVQSHRGRMKKKIQKSEADIESV
jgi:DNA-binding CsgD family transcriptional regulator